jgi:hypothetical protein
MSARHPFAYADWSKTPWHSLHGWQQRQTSDHLQRPHLCIRLPNHQSQQPHLSNPLRFPNHHRRLSHHRHPRQRSWRSLTRRF